MPFIFMRHLIGGGRTGGVAAMQPLKWTVSIHGESVQHFFVRKQLNIPGLAFVSAGRWLKYAQAQIDFRRSVVANKRNGAMVRILEQSNNLSLCCTTVSLVFYSGVFLFMVHHIFILCLPHVAAKSHSPTLTAGNGHKVSCSQS